MRSMRGCDGPVLVCCVVLVAAAARGCTFPDFVQDNGTARAWRSRVRDQNTRADVTVSFRRNVLTVTSRSGAQPASSLVCLQDLGGMKYLVAHEEPGQTHTRYSCVRILRRGRHVIQLAHAQPSGQMDAGLCDNRRLTLDPWVVLDTAQFRGHVEPCPLVGGYSIRVLDNRRSKAVCDSLRGETRMESECLRHEGLVLYFRHVQCLPQGLYMYPTQRLLCLATWKQGDFRYTVLKHDKLDYLWLHQLPLEAADSFSSFLLQDLVAESSNQIKLTPNFLRIDVVRDTPRPMTSLCADEYEACTAFSDPCRLGDEMVMSCPRTCGVCNVTRPAPCSFHAQLQGKWYEQGASKPTITISQSALSVRGYYRFHCVDWERGAPHTNPNYQQMLVTTFDNGCRPRYTCSVFRQGSPAVLFLKLSQSRVWPLAGARTDRIDCGGFTYQRDAHPAHKTMQGFKYHARHFRPLFSRTVQHTSSCDLGNISEVKVTFREGATCWAEIHQPSARHRITLNLTGDCGSVTSLEPSTEFECLEASRLHPSEDRLIITRSGADKSPDYHCWFFPKRHKNKFYLVDSTQCNEVTRRRIKKERLKPLAVLRLKTRRRGGGGRPSDRQKEPPTLPKPNNLLDDVSDDVTQRPFLPRSVEDTRQRNRSYTVVDSRRRGGDVTVTPADRDHAADVLAASPLVVVAAVITFALFQIPCVCKSAT